MKKHSKNLWAICLLLVTIILTSCDSPAIVIYQKGVGVAKGKIMVSEIRNLNRVDVCLEGKVDSGQKVIIKTKLY